MNRVPLDFETWFTERLSHLFSPTQIELLLRPKHKVFLWTPENVSSAISLRIISTKAYQYLRDKKNFYYRVIFFYLIIIIFIRTKL